MRKTMTFVRVAMVAALLAAGSGVALAQDDAGAAAVAAPATPPETAPSAPETAPAAAEPSAEPATAAADSGPESASEAPAPGEVSDGDAVGLVMKAFQAIRDRAWGVFAAAFAMIFVVAWTRGWVGKIPGVTWVLEKWWGGPAFAFAVAFAGAFGHAGLAGAAINTDLVWTAVKIGGLAIGGWAGIWKQWADRND